MPVTRVDSAKPVSAKVSVDHAIDLAMKDVKKVQSRMTEELRAEDAIRGMSFKNGKVEVQVDDRYSIKPEGLKSLAAALLAKHGVTVSVSLVKTVKPEAAVDAAMADVTKIQHRVTRELRCEDGIKDLSLADGSVLVTLKVGQPYDHKQIEGAVKRLLAEHGLKGAKVSLVDSLSPAKAKEQAAVDESWMSIFSIQHRLTTDIRPEDDVVGLSLKDKGTVAVVLRARTNSSDNDIKAAVTKQLADHGMKNAKLDVIRPAIEPMPPGFGRPVSKAPMKVKVEAMNADLAKVHSRMTEELRIEDGVKSVVLKGSKVEITVQPSAMDPDGAAAWAKEELKKRGVTLPVVVKGLDVVTPAETKAAKGLYAALHNRSQLQATPAGAEPKFDSAKGAYVSSEGQAMFELRLRFATGGAPMPTTSAIVDPRSNTYYTRTDDPMGRTGARFEGPELLPQGSRFSGGGYSAAQVQKLAEAAQKGVPSVRHDGPPRP